LSTDQLILTVVTITFLVLSVSIHEAAHAWVAYRCGDPTAKRLGRMTFNPIVHIDPMWSIVLPVMLYLSTNGGFVFGGARPVPVNSLNLGVPYRDMMWVAIAGPISNLLQACVYVAIVRILIVWTPYDFETLMIRALINASFMNIVLAVFNMIPMPPLDGSRVLRYFLPNQQRDAMDRFEPLGIIVVMALLWGVPGVSQWLQSTTFEIFRGIWFITGGGWL
jgi:Zn-dependent protease